MLKLFIYLNIVNKSKQLTMKKLLPILTVCLLLLSVESHAKLLDFGIKGGVNFPSLNSTDDGVDFDSKSGWHAGVMAKVNIPIVSIQGEVLYSQTNFSIPGGDDFKNANLAIPITAHLSLLNIFSIHAGPQFAFATSQKLGDVDFSDQIDNKTVSFVAGAGVMLGALDVHFRFIFPSKTEIGVTDIAEYKSNNWQLSIGYWFGE